MQARFLPIVQMDGSDHSLFAIKIAEMAINLSLESAGKNADQAIPTPDYFVQSVEKQRSSHSLNVQLVERIHTSLKVLPTSILEFHVIHIITKEVLSATRTVVLLIWKTVESVVVLLARPHVELLWLTWP